MRFFELNQETRGGPRPLTTDLGPVEPYNRGDAHRCPRCGGYISMLTWLPPYRVVLEPLGKSLTDFAFGAASVLVSGAVLDEIRRRGLKIDSAFPSVEVVRVKPRRLFAPRLRYHYMELSPSTVAIDDERSGIVWTDREPYCDYCGGHGKQSMRSLVIDMSTWHGEDAFHPRKGGRIVVSQRFVEMCRQCEFTGARFLEGEEAGFEFP